MTDETRQSPTEAVSHEPVAWIAFASNGNIRFWTSDPLRAATERAGGLDIRAFTLPELVFLSARAWPFEPKRLVDWTYLYALEGQGWPDTTTITEPLICLAGSRAPSQDDAERLKAGETLKQLNTLQRPEGEQD